MIKKIIIIIINILLSLWIMFSFNNSKTFLSILKETCYLWFSVLVPSILPMYFFSNLLLINERLFNVLYKLTSKLFHFENTTSCMLFFLSFITSNPTITILIKDAVDNNKISLFEGNRLMRCTNHFSIIFIKINSRNSYYFNLILFSLYLASIIILILSKNIQDNSYKIINIKNNYDLYSLFDKSYQLLLKILVIMIMINYLISFIKYLIPISNIEYLLSILEITLGTTYLNNNIRNDFLYHLLFLILLSFSGISLIFQIIIVNKKTMDILNFLKYRIVHLILSITIFLTFHGLLFLHI